MRQCQVRHGPNRISTLPTCIRNAIRSTDDEAQISSVSLPIDQSGGQGLAAQLLTSLVQKDDLFIYFDAREYLLALRIHRVLCLIIL